MRIFDRYRLLTRAERRGWILLSLVGVVTVAVETATGGVVYALVAYLTNPANAASRPLLAPIVERLPGETALAKTIAFVLLVGAFHLVRTLFTLVLRHLHLRLSNRSTFELSCRLFALYLSAPYSFHLARDSVELTTHVFHTSSYVFWILNGVVNLGTQALSILGLLSVVFYVSPWPTLATAAVVAAALAFFLRLTRRLYETAARQQAGFTMAIDRHAQRGFAAFKELRVLGRSGFYAEAYERDKMASLAIALRLHTMDALPRVLIEAIFGAGIVVAVAAGAARGHQHLAPLLSLFAYVGVRAVPAAVAVANELSAIRSYLALTDTVLADLRSLGAATTTTGPAGPRIARALTVEDVSFSYEGAGAPALCGVSLEIRRGELLGIVGPSGAGKTTLGDLILGLHRPATGSVRIDGRDVGALGLRAHAGYVPQSVYLIDDTLRRNVAFALADGEIDETRVRRAVHLARLDGLVAGLERGLDTPLKERGARLSGGERQRVAIARALYDEPDLIVLDEATSSLDPATEAEVMRTLEALRGERTIVIISQRLSTVEKCDRVVMLRAGRVVAEGRPAELAATSAEFRTWAGLEHDGAASEYAR